MTDLNGEKFEQAAADADRSGFFSELWGFLKENKKWWLLPVLGLLLIFGLLLVLSGTGLAPFIYTLF